uniref:VAN3-binding protein-like auxin canalisation domain-containing protein n=1 Tax=Cucumis sativus TaxID=3659 RepID=A0A0A0K1A3_CUCSA
MNSKPFILLGLLFSIVILSSEDVNTVTARDVKFSEFYFISTPLLDDDTYCNNKKLLWKLMNFMTKSTAMVLEEDKLDSSNNASMVAGTVVVAASVVVASIAARLAGEAVVDDVEPQAKGIPTKRILLLQIMALISQVDMYRHSDKIGWSTLNM